MIDNPLQQLLERKLQKRIFGGDEKPDNKHLRFANSAKFQWFAAVTKPKDKPKPKSTAKPDSEEESGDWLTKQLLEFLSLRLYIVFTSK